MDTLTIRQKLHDYINDADDEKVEAMFTVIEDEKSGRYEWWKDGDLMKELDRRYNDLKSGKDKGMSLDEATTHLLKRLK
jgi:hypothetical protein